MTPARLIQALPPRAAEALLLARQFDRDCDPAAAWLMAIDRPDAAPAALARALRAQARRNRRAGGPHGPARFTALGDGDLTGAADPAGDPADLLTAGAAVAQRTGLAAALAEREPATDTRRLAATCRVSRRRAQQVLAARRAADRAGQQALDLELGLAWKGGAT